MVSFVSPENLPEGKLDDLREAGAFVAPSTRIILFEGIEGWIPWEQTAYNHDWTPYSSQGTYALIHKAVDTNQRSKEQGHEEASEEEETTSKKRRTNDGDSSKSASNRHQVNLLVPGPMLRPGASIFMETLASTAMLGLR